MEYSRSIEGFLKTIPDADERSAGEFIELFSYFLTIEQGEPTARPSQVRACFETAGLPPHSNISQYFLRHLTGKSVRFVRRGKGYILARSLRLELDELLRKDQVTRETATSLRELMPLVPTETERGFLEETIDCYEVGAYRAAIVMGWSLTVDHIFGFILANRLTDFNSELAKVNDKRIKVKSVIHRDDFTEIPESKFIELCRSAGVISADVRKILDDKLGIRNSCAHPSGIKVSQHKATEFLNDLVENVVVKYEI